MEPILKEATIALDNIHKSILPQIPPWIIKNPKVNLQLNQLDKTKTHPFTYQEKHQNIIQQHPDYLCIYKDGSKDYNKTACAAVLNKIIKTKALLMDCSIFTAEACAIDLALDIISKEKHKKFIILRHAFCPIIIKQQKTRAPTYYQTTLQITLNIKQRNRFLLNSKPHWGERKS